jgi:hypothetical protein
VCTPAPASGAVTVSIHNGTTADLSAVVYQENQPASGPKPVQLPAGQDTMLSTFSAPGQIQVQAFPAAPSTGANQVFTLTVSSELSGNNTLIVGQMVNGDG